MKRKTGLALMCAAITPLAATSIAWACGVTAIMTTTTKVAAPGQAVTVSGKNFSSNAVTATPVTIHLRTRTGQQLGGNIAPDQSGRITSTFNLPSDLSPGWYVLLATQFNTADGTPRAGTPARTTLRVQGTAAAAATPWSAPSGPPAAFASDTGGGSLVPMLAALALSLTMLAGGWTLVGRRGRPASSSPLAT